MKNVMDESSKLVNEYAPEVKVANNLERSSLMAMYNMMGYAWSEREDYLKAGREHLAQVEGYLGEAKQFADRSIHLVKLKTQVDHAAAVQYMENCAAFLQSQNSAMTAEIGDESGMERLL